jgi:hypothetical protein
MQTLGIVIVIFMASGLVCRLFCAIAARFLSGPDERDVTIKRDQ